MRINKLVAYVFFLSPALITGQASVKMILILLIHRIDKVKSEERKKGKNVSADSRLDNTLHLLNALNERITLALPRVIRAYEEKPEKCRLSSSTPLHDHTKILGQ